MKTSDKVIAVTSTSFSRSDYLRQKLLSHFPNSKFKESSGYLNQEDLIEFLQGADGVVIGLEKMGIEVLAACPQLKIAAKYGVGLDNLDTPAFADKKVTIGWTGGVNRMSVAEQALAVMISLSRNLYQTSNLLSAGTWHKDGGKELSESVIGIIGVGFIGKALIGLLKPFGSHILVNDIIEQDAYYAQENLNPVSKEAIFQKADIISLHTPLTDQTHHLINANSLGKMKSNAIVINTARGGIICQDDLKTALAKQQIKAAALDVYEQEPPTDQEFLSLPNLFCTPHIAGNSTRSINAMGESAISHLVRYFLD